MDETKFDLVGSMMAFESGEQSARETLEMFAVLIEDGVVWNLQGFYGRTAKEMIDGGFITPEGKMTDFAEQMLELFEG